MSTVTDRLARVALSCFDTVTPSELALQVETLGVIETLDLHTTIGYASGDQRTRTDRLAQAHQLIDTHARGGVRILIPGDADWPDRLPPMASIADTTGGSGYVRPLCLWTQGSGDLGALMSRAVAVVGRRSASRYARHVARHIGAGLAVHGWTVAADEDNHVGEAALRGALDAGGPTIAVTGSGIGCLPNARSQLLADAAATGLVVTATPPETPAWRQRLTGGGAIVGGLSAGVVAIEAPAAGGATQALATATALGRVAMAVPGPVTDPTQHNTHTLLRDQPELRLVTCAREIVDQVM